MYCLRNTKMWYFLLIFATVFGVVQMEGCAEDDLNECSVPLKKLGDATELALVTQKEELVKLCPDLHTALTCINSYTRRCMNMHERNHFHQLHQGTSGLINELCEEGSYYQEEFLSHTPCLRKVRTSLRSCSNRYQQKLSWIDGTTSRRNSDKSLNETKIDRESIKLLCCAFTEYMSCTDHAVRRFCGDETADFTKKFHARMSNSILELHCSEFKGNAECGRSSSSRTSSLTIASLGLVSMVCLFSLLKRS